MNIPIAFWTHLVCLIVEWISLQEINEGRPKHGWRKDFKEEAVCYVKNKNGMCGWRNRVWCNKSNKYSFITECNFYFYSKQ